jgi:hypothetical protein
MEISGEDGRWMELAQDRVQWRALLLAVLNLGVLLPESKLLHNFFYKYCYKISPQNAFPSPEGAITVSSQSFRYNCPSVMQLDVKKR